MVSNPEWGSEREAKLEALHERLTAAVEGLVTGEDWIRVMTFAAQFRSRSFANTLLIYAQHAERYAAGSITEPWPSYVAGFRQWESLGRSVERGQRGYMIQAPVTARFASATPSDANSWWKLGFREAPKAGEVVRTKIVNVKPAYVHAQDLQPGDQLHGITGEPVIVHQAIINPQDSPITVYNFEVKDYHTYYAGQAPVLVHNAGQNYKPLKPGEVISDLLKNRYWWCRVWLELLSQQCLSRNLL
ncbi:MAG: HINT domain-containing protein [Propionibacteriaceae bacterium]|jgi:hypothetical protein|nr:HINT domain-containing protein [Propionibacteriaceae bacterium]